MFSTTCRQRRGSMMVMMIRVICTVLCGWFLVLQATQLRDLLIVQQSPTTSNHPHHHEHSSLEKEQQLQQQQQQLQNLYVVGGSFNSRHVLNVEDPHPRRSWDEGTLLTDTTANTATTIESSSSSSTSSKSSKSKWNVDILSIGSQSRLEYIHTQRNTFGLHQLVRNFFNVTEFDDDLQDKNCNQQLTFHDLMKISNFCKQQYDDNDGIHVHHQHQWNFLMKYLTTHYYADRNFLSKKKNPIGWLCAQKRPLLGLYKVIQYYRRRQQESLQQQQQQQQISSSASASSSASSSILPDYLIIMDDDTYYNMELFEQYFFPSSTSSSSSSSSPGSSNSDIPRGIAGCMIRSPIQSINFTLPYGGFGFIMSRGYLQNIMQPIHCLLEEVEVEERDDNDDDKNKKNKKDDDHKNSNNNNNNNVNNNNNNNNNDGRQRRQDQEDFNINMKDICYGIHQVNHLNEKPLFHNGMSLVDLLYTYTIHQPYTVYQNWTTGFCLHSDWVFGYLTNFYNITHHVLDPIYATVPHARMESYVNSINSELFAGLKNQGGRGICDFEHEYCHSMSHACHYSTPEQMQSITNIIRQRIPHKFRDGSGVRTGNEEPHHPHHAYDDTSVSAAAMVTTGEESSPTTVLPLPPLPSSLPFPVIDILSIGSRTNEEDFFLRTQEATFGSHKSVRNFFKVTQADNHVDTLCDASTMPNQKTNNLEEEHESNGGATTNERRRAPEWLCSQRRPIMALYNALEQYEKTPQQDLPDYIILMRDDTYYNMVVFQEIMNQNYPNASSTPQVIVGCKIRFKAFPFQAAMSNLGSILSRGSLQKLRRPIHCNDHGGGDGIDKVNKESETNDRCLTIQANRIGEGPLFKEGMTVADLMYAYVTHDEPPRPQNEFCALSEFCQQSDWLLGYFINYYNISQHVPNPKFVDWPNARIEAFLKSRLVSATRSVGKLCRNQGVSQCHSDAVFCAQIPPDIMVEYVNRTRQLAPHQFRPQL